MKNKILIMLAVTAFPGVALAHQGHEHASNVPVVSWGLQGIKEMINLHPLFVHFPIALLLGAVAFYFLGLILKKEELLGAGKWALFAGVLGAAVSVWSGLEAAETVFHDAEIHKIMMAHQYTGIAILVLSAALSLWVIVSKKAMPSTRILFLGMLLLLSGLIAQAADFGGRMVYGKGVGVGLKSMMAGMGNHAEHSQGH